MYTVGRSGAPKRRLLYCNDEVTELYWSDKLNEGPVFPPKRSRTIHLKSVMEVRKGTELDPNHMPKLGTPTLRRHCNREDMHLCFSLILPKRLVTLCWFVLFGNNSLSLFQYVERLTSSAPTAQNSKWYSAI